MRRFLRRSLSDNTWRSYGSDLKDFAQWTGLAEPLPTTTSIVSRYLASRAERGLSPNTLAHRIAALRFWHKNQGYTDPCDAPLIRGLMKGIRREWADAGNRSAQAPVFTPESVQRMAALEPESLIEYRDRALFLVGLAGGCRQSELARMRIEDMEPVEGGFMLRVGPHKGDPGDESGARRAFPDAGGRVNPVSALNAWLEQAGIRRGVVFRSIEALDDEQRKLSQQAMNTGLRRLARRAGVKDYSRYSIHSLRASYVTRGLALGLPPAVIAEQTLHRNLRLLETYYRPRAGIPRQGVKDVLAGFENLAPEEGES